MPAQRGYFDTLKSTAGKVFTYLASITLTGTDGKTITCTQDTSLDEAVAMSSKATQEIGAWTPSPQGFTFGAPGTYTVEGRYTKIGRRVFIDGMIQATGGTTIASSGGSAVSITGLPFTVYNSNAAGITSFVNPYTMDSLGAGPCSSNTTVIYVPAFAATGANHRIQFSGSYDAAS